MSLLEQAFQQIDRQDAARFLQDLVRINSVNPPGNEKEVAEAIAKRLTGSGLEVVVDDLGGNRANLMVSLAGSADQEKVLVFSGHFDTVPPGSLPWEFGPFSGEVVGNRLYGRGTTDMKAGVAAMVLAMEALQRSGIKLKGTLRFIGTAGEEVDGYGAKEVIRRGQAQDASAMIISEPTSNQAVVAHKGALWLEIKTYGKTAHGSMPDQGINAILAMNHFLNAIAQYEFSYQEHPVLGKPTLNVATIQGGVKTNVVPDQCILTIDIRTVPGQSHAEIVADLQKLLAGSCETVGATGELQVLNDMSYIATSPDDPFIQLSQKTTEKYFNHRLIPQGANYYTDGSVYGPALNIPILIMGPGEPTLAHQPNEWVDIEKYLDSIRYFMAIAVEYLEAE